MAKRSVRFNGSDAVVLGPSDSELIQRFLGGEESAFNELYSRHYGWLFKTALKLFSGDADAAEEIVEVCWLKVLRNIRGFNGSGTFDGWVSRMLYNLFKDQFKKGEYKHCEQVPGNVEFEEWCPADSSLDPLEQLILKEENELLLRCLNSLSRPLSQVVYLACFEEMKYKDIAKALNVNEGAVKMRLHRARLLLAQAVA